MHETLLNTTLFTNMKIATKPISSPGRTDELPQLIMFPRSKSSRGGSSKSSRSNPMFVRKINKNETSQEPSSPKVTCIGQVRAKRGSSNNKKQATTTRSTTNVRRCKWLPRNISLFRCGRKPKKLKESKEMDTCRKCGLEDVTRNDHKDVSISKSPPKNAFLLTRSRSLPYRGSSSLANKIWESTIDEKKCDETQGGINENIGKENEENEGCIINGIEAKSLNLSRCKSEPARASDKLFMSFGL